MSMELVAIDFDGGAYTGVTADVIVLQHILVDEETDPMLLIVHQAHNTDRAGFNIQIFQHIRRLRKGEPGRSDLL